MTAHEILAKVRGLGVRLVVIDGKLRATPPGLIPPDLKAAVRDRVDEIKARLSAGEPNGAPETGNLNRPACPACHGTDLRVSEAGGLVCGGCARFLFLHVEPDATAYASSPLRRCGALVCSDCRIHSPGPHRETCRVPRLEPCGSRWFWLSPFRALKCVACASPTDLSLVEGWVLARESRVPDEIFKLLQVEAPAQ
jgi:hypothetical protein